MLYMHVRLVHPSKVSASAAASQDWASAKDTRQVDVKGDDCEYEIIDNGGNDRLRRVRMCWACTCALCMLPM